MRIIHSVIAVSLSLVLLPALNLLSGCSEKRTPTTLPDAHPASWMDVSSADFHGFLVLADGTVSCGVCHGVDGPGGKVGVSCTDCHGPSGSTCAVCHGGVDNSSGAPPKGLAGETAKTTLAVGAHTAHMEASSLAASVPCSTCHLVPTFTLDSAHLDLQRDPAQALDSVAEVIFQGLAEHPSAKWNRSAATCSGVYCHGQFAGGDSSNSPVWTGNDQATCGSCHDVGSAPVSLGWKHELHVVAGNLACAECHANVVDSGLNIIDPALHVNGSINTQTRDSTVCSACHGSGTGSCTTCHGGLDNQSGAPPYGLRGETSTALVPVGAHRSHVEDGSLAAALECVACHLTPTSVLDPGHLGADSVAEVTFGGIAPAPGVSWDHVSAVCSNTYCHGNFAGGDPSNSPVWTARDQALCGSCHDVGANPAALGWKHDGHVNAGGLTCTDCHASTVDTLLNILDIAVHVNGQVDTLTRDPAVCEQCHGSSPAACTHCHGGTDNLTGAPPTGLRGETATGRLAVGAHTAHMEGGSLSDAFSCSDCHLVPANLLSAGHYDPDSVAELTFSTLAGPSSTWNRTAATCSNTYCHGNFNGGTTANSPLWTGSNQATCGSCHDDGTSPWTLSGRHDKHIRDRNLECRECHASVVDQQDTIVGLDLHVNGARDVSLLRGGTYSGGSCSGLDGNACHDRHNW